VLKDELKKMLPHDDDADRLIRNSFHFAEFFNAFDVEPPKASGVRALLWAHCHQRATGGVDPDVQVLKKMGVDVKQVNGGCCGLAGSWGFEQGKYEMSLDCGEQSLLPTIRKHPDALVVANGFSCQTQISDSGTATALHLGQVMAMANVSADIRSVTPPSAEVFVLPYVPIYYFFAERRTPTRYDLVLPGNVGAGCRHGGRRAVDAKDLAHGKRLGGNAPMAFAEYQNELYQQGQAGRQPPWPIRFADLEAKAAAAMPPKVLGYVAGGAGDEYTQRANCAAFKRWGLYPRMGIAPEDRDMSVELFGITLASPIFMAPIGVMLAAIPPNFANFPKPPRWCFTATLENRM